MPQRRHLFLRFFGLMSFCNVSLLFAVPGVEAVVDGAACSVGGLPPARRVAVVASPSLISTDAMQTLRMREAFVRAQCVYAQRRAVKARAIEARIASDAAYALGSSVIANITDDTRSDQLQKMMQHYRNRDIVSTLALGGIPREKVYAAIQTYQDAWESAVATRAAVLRAFPGTELPALPAGDALHRALKSILLKGAQDRARVTKDAADHAWENFEETQAVQGGGAVFAAFIAQRVARRADAFMRVTSSESADVLVRDTIQAACFS